MCPDYFDWPSLQGLGNPGEGDALRNIDKYKATTGAFLLHEFTHLSSKNGKKNSPPRYNSVSRTDLRRSADITDQYGVAPPDDDWSNSDWKESTIDMSY